MLSADDNELLTRTDAGTPMGDLFRRFWLPVLLSRELPEPDGPPLRVKVLGADFVWAYLGPAEHEPALPELEFALVPPPHRFVSKKLQQCNWAQA